MKNDPRSYDRNFCNCVKKPEKKEQLTQAVERVETFSEQLIQAIPTSEGFFWRDTQAVQMDGVFFWTDTQAIWMGDSSHSNG